MCLSNSSSQIRPNCHPKPTQSITLRPIKRDSILSRSLDGELTILNWIFYHVCKDQQKKLAVKYGMEIDINT